MTRMINLLLPYDRYDRDSPIFELSVHPVDVVKFFDLFVLVRPHYKFFFILKRPVLSPMKYSHHVMVHTK